MYSYYVLTDTEDADIDITTCKKEHWSRYKFHHSTLNVKSILFYSVENFTKCYLYTTSAVNMQHYIIKIR